MNIISILRDSVKHCDFMCVCSRLVPYSFVRSWAGLIIASLFTEKDLVAQEGSGQTRPKN